MALQIELKPGERLILGNSIITNDDHRTKLRIEGNTPILREPDIMRTEEADTPCKRIYLVIQTMYLAPDASKFNDTYFELFGEIYAAAPSTMPYFDQINNQILTGSFYKALKKAKDLIAYEKELMTDAGCSTGLRPNSKDHAIPA